MTRATDAIAKYAIRFWQADGESEKTSIRTQTSLGQMVEEGHYKGGTGTLVNGKQNTNVTQEKKKSNLFR